MADVYLDGEKVKYAVEADDVEGWVRRGALNEQGRPVADLNSPDDGLRTEVVRGAVEIRFTPPEYRALAEAEIARRAQGDGGA